MEEKELFAEVFTREIAGLMQCSDYLQAGFPEQIGRILCECTGNLYFSGVGKNVFVVEKIVHTMQSLGFCVYFLDPVGSLHGDIGVLTSRDILCIFSKSGNTKELIRLHESVKERNVTTIAVTCSAQSHLARECDYSQCLPAVKEADESNIIPTATTTMFLCYGDALAMYLHRVKSKEYPFLQNHPGGDIGERNVRHMLAEKRSRIRVFVTDVDGTLTDGKLYYSADLSVSEAYHVKDGYGIKEILPEYGISSIAITGRVNNTLKHRAQALNFTQVHLGVADKANLLKQIAQCMGVGLDQIAYIGDDINDLACLRSCGLAGCPADASDEVIKSCHFVSKYKGGAGAVREFIDWICSSRPKWDEGVYDKKKSSGICADQTE